MCDDSDVLFIVGFRDHGSFVCYNVLVSDFLIS